MLVRSKFVGINHFNTRISFLAEGLRRYNEETKFSVTPSFVLTHSSDSISAEELLAEGLLYTVAIWPVAGQGVENTK